MNCRMRMGLFMAAACALATACGEIQTGPIMLRQMVNKTLRVTTGLQPNSPDFIPFTIEILYDMEWICGTLSSAQATVNGVSIPQDFRGGLVKDPEDGTSQCFAPLFLLLGGRTVAPDPAGKDLVTVSDDSASLQAEFIQLLAPRTAVLRTVGPVHRGDEVTLDFFPQTDQLEGNSIARGALLSFKDTNSQSFYSVGALRTQRGAAVFGTGFGLSPGTWQLSARWWSIPPTSRCDGASHCLAEVETEMQVGELEVQ